MKAICINQVPCNHWKNILEQKKTLQRNEMDGFSFVYETRRNIGT